MDSPTPMKKQHRYCTHLKPDTTAIKTNSSYPEITLISEVNLSVIMLTLKLLNKKLSCQSTKYSTH